MKTIVLSNNKGGVCKTTTAYALAAGLNNHGKSVLIVDIDPQANLSDTAGVDLLNLKASLYDVFKSKASIEDAIQPIKLQMDIVTAGLDMTSADMEFTQTGREYMLKEAIETVQGRYDYCVIDTPPTLGILTMNAVTAGDFIIIPMFADRYSLQGIRQLGGFINNSRKYTNPGLSIMGLLLTKYKPKETLPQVLAQDIEKAAEQLATKVFKARIRESAAVRETQELKGSLYDEAPKATATQDYIEFVKEVESILQEVNA